MGNTNEGPQADAAMAADATSGDKPSSSSSSSSDGMSSEASMIEKRLGDELKSMVAEMIESKDFEDISDIEPEAQTALVRAAKEICYTRKYYNVAEDEIIYFPSLIKTIKNNSLFELAGKYHQDADQAYPEEYSLGLRKVAFARMAKEGLLDYDDSDGEEEEMDDQLMMRLSQPVGIPAAVTPTAAITSDNDNENKKEKGNTVSSLEPAEKPLVWKQRSRDQPTTPIKTATASTTKGTMPEGTKSPLIWTRGSTNGNANATAPVAATPSTALSKPQESPRIWQRGSVQPAAVVDLTTKTSAEKTEPEEDAPFQPTGPTLVWQRGSVMNHDDISLPVDNFNVEDEPYQPAKNHTVSEDEIQQRLGMRRQASFLRKASILDSLEKFYEPDPMSKSAKKKSANKDTEMRLTKIDNELKGMIKEMLELRDFEDETDMEPQAHQALVKSAKELCYTRKYYDASADEVIFIPSLVKTIVNNGLFEKADQYYGKDEFEEFPEEYSLGLRKVAFSRMAKEGLEYQDSDGEEEEVEFAMMMQLSQPVVDLTAPAASSVSKKKQNQPKVLRDSRMDTSEETFVWTRSSRNMDEASMLSAVSAIPEQPTKPVRKEEAPVKKPTVTEEEVQRKLSMRRQDSFLRKAAILDSIGKHEADEKEILPSIGESSTKKKSARPSTLMDKRMDSSEETLVWTRGSMGAVPTIAFDPPSAQTGPPKKEEAPAKKPELTEEEVQRKLGMRRQASFLRKAAILDSIGKHEADEKEILPSIGESSSKKKKSNNKDSEMLLTKIDTELKSMIEEMLQLRDFEDETDMEPQAHQALVKSAKELCYTRKFYDITADEVIYLPSLVKTIVNNSLFEKADQHYGKDEFEEFPEEYSLSLRKVAFSRMAKEGLEYQDSDGEEEDEDFARMMKLSRPVDRSDSVSKKARSSLRDSRMDASEETFVWARSSRNLDEASMLAALASVPDQPTKPTRKEEVPTKKPAVTEEEVQQRLGMRRQASFLRKAAILESIGKHESDEKGILPPIGESSTKKKKARPSTLVDKRMDASEETFVWARSSRNMDEASMLAAVADIPEQPTKPVRKEEAPVKKPAVTEEEVQRKLSMRRQDSFLRKAAIMDSIGKHEGEEKSILPAIVESSTKKKSARPSTLVDKRMDTSEETLVWTRGNMGAGASIEFGAFGPGQQPSFTNKQEVPAKKPALTEEEVQQKLGMRRQASFLRKAAILDSIGKQEGEEKELLPAIGESSVKKKKGRPSTLVDKRMDASEETLVWTRGNMDADATIEFGAFGPGQMPAFPKTKEAPAKKQIVTEEDIKERLGLRREASTVRKAEIMGSLGKWETDQDPLPEIQHDEGTTETAASDDTSPSSDDKESPPEASKAPLSEAAKRQNMIDTELNGMIEEMMKSEDFEEEDEMEKESKEAIFKAAKEMCYTRKIYDISSDKIVFFPSITKLIVNYDLFEKATEYYYDEGDEFPTEYTMGLRQVAFDRIEAEGGDDDDEEMDDDMMERLSMPVQLTEDEPDPLEEAAAAAAEEGGDDKKENEAPPANAGRSIDADESDEKQVPAKPLSEAAKRQDMIDTELNGMITDMLNSEGFEDETEMEKESYDAIMKAAKEICYTRKMYDISTDKIIFFPSITKLIVNYDLFDKASKYYYEDDDETDFPSDYAMGLRQVAFERIEAEGGDEDNDEMDDDMMERLSMPVQLTEDEPDPLEEAAAAQKAEDEVEVASESVGKAVLPAADEGEKEILDDNVWDYEFKTELISTMSTRVSSPPPPKPRTRSMPEPRSPFTLLPPRNAVDVGKNIVKAAVSVIVFVVVDAVGLFLKTIIFPDGMF